MADRVAPFMRDARRLAARIQSDGEARAVQLREAFAVLKEQGPAMLTRLGAVESGRIAYGNAHATVTVTVVATAHVFSSDSGHGEDTISVERAGVSSARSTRLRAGYLFYIILVWLLWAGVGVAGEMVNLSPHIQSQIQDDAQAVSIAFDLTVVFLSMRKR